MRRLALALLATIPLLAACGSSEDEPTTQATAGAEASAFPVTLTTKQGPITIEKAPKRVVALDFPSTDALLALGVTPIAMAKVSYVPGDVQAWTKTALKGATPKLLDTTRDYPLEAIAALRPDLIVATNAYSLDPAYAKLKRLAPVVTYEQGAGMDSWQQSTVLVGKALGQEAKARKLVADTEARVAQVRKDHAQFEGKTVTLFNYVGGQAYAISAPTDFSIRFLSTLGFKLSPTVERLGKKSKGAFEARLQVSKERLELLDADVVLGTTSESPTALKALARDPLFQRAVERDHYATLDIGPATSMAFPSVLSVNWALDEIVPVLDRLTAQS